MDNNDSKKTDDKERIKAITLIAQYYRQRMELIKSITRTIGKQEKYRPQIFNR